MPKKRRFSKYGNKKVTIDGIVFDSKKEYEHYELLCLKQAAGEITDLQRQVKFEIKPAYYEDVVVQLKTKTKVVKLYFILFLHQTTTDLGGFSSGGGCILFCFYIKPQRCSNS